MSVADVLPPSPPTTSSRKQRLPSFPLPPTSTPDDSPASGPPSSFGSRKRVNFSDWTDVHHASEAPNVTKDSEVRPLPPSRDCSASGKSILKFNVQESRLSAGHDGSDDQPQSMHDVMESIVHQLIRNDPMECVDAYQTLAAAVKAYDELPDQAVLRSKLHLITKAMKQHLCVLDNSEPKPVDINLTTSALKVLVILVWNSDFSPFLTDEFRLFVLDRAITTIVEHRAPKSVIVHYLHFLATQDFRHNLLTSSRASRLIDALNTLTEHVKGNGVVSERLLVYSKLLDQAKAVMKSKAATWIEHMLSAMVSTIADTRMKALGLGRKACQCFPPSNSIAPVVKAILDSEQDERHTKGSAVCKKLEKLVVTRDNADAVPQMWAVVILLCNSSTANLASWPGLTAWLQLIQRCFNASDSNLRIQADLAWNRFIYAARPYETTDDKFASMLAKPLVAQLERKLSDKSGKSTYAAAMSSYCNLLYYAMRPAISPQRLTKSWNEYLVKVMRSSFLQNAANADMACRILMSLFWNWKPGQKLWNENRAHENRIVEPEELPTIDCKWVRSKAAPITELFESLFKHCSWGFEESAEQAYVSKAWRSFTKSIRSASSKEIKMSNDSRKATLAILESINRLSDRVKAQKTSKDGSEDSMTDGVLFSIARTAVNELQVGHILEVLEADPTAMSATLLRSMRDELERELQISSDAPSRQLTDSIVRFTDCLNTFVLGEHSVECSDAKRAEHTTLLCKALALLKPDYAQPALIKLQEVLSIHIQDEDRSLESAVVDQFAASISTVISRLDPGAVVKLDKLIAACFASTHRTIVSAMATTWNESFGECESLQIGPLLVESLQRLRPYVELRMPVGCMDSWSELRDSAPVYGTQDASISAPYSTIEKGLPEPTLPLMKASAEDVAVVEERPTPPTRHSRYNDSQVMFVPVHSSPPSKAQESQYLTDRQREVRDRQRTETAVVFADLRSSPRPASRATSETRDCGLARKAAKMAERPSTPPLADQHDEAEIQASPTPKSRYLRNVADVEIPSSPPSIQDQQEQVTNKDRAAAPSPDPQPHAEETSAAAINLSNNHLTSGERLDSPQGPSTSIVQHEYQQGNEQVNEPEQLGKDTGPTTIVIENPPSQTTGLDGRDNGNGLDADSTTSLDKVDREIEKPFEVADATHLDASNDEGETVIAQAANLESKMTDFEHGSLPTAGLQLAEGQVVVKHLANVEPPSTPQKTSSRIDSDELESMSASQLSNDLDWSVVFSGLDESPALPARPPTALQKSSSLPPDSQNVQPKTQGRKRKAAASGWSRNKKSKKKPQQESVNTTSQESYIKIESDDEDESMIEVMTSSDPPVPSSPAQVDADGDTFVDAPESQEQQMQKKKRRGRPRASTQRRKSARVSRQSSEIEVHQNSFVEQQRHANTSRDPEQVRREESHVSAAAQYEELNSSPPPGAVQESVMLQIVPREEAQPVETAPSLPVQADAGANPSQEPVDGHKAMQVALAAVMNGDPNSMTLRYIDEMCFQIRFQAQLRGVK